MRSLRSTEAWNNRDWAWMTRAIRTKPVEEVIKELVFSHPLRKSGLSKYNSEQLQAVVHELLYSKEKFKRLALANFLVPINEYGICVNRILRTLQNPGIWGHNYFAKEVGGIHKKKRKTVIREVVNWYRAKQFHGVHELSNAQKEKVIGDLLGLRKTIWRVARRNFANRQVSYPVQIEYRDMLHRNNSEESSSDVSCNTIAIYIPETSIY